jgi:hypothetical protein
MELPELNTDGYLDEGIYIASLDEIAVRFGIGTPARERCGNLLRLIVASARKYPTIKRVLLWAVLSLRSRNRGIWIIRWL